MEITEGRLAVGMIPDDAAEVHCDTRTLPEGAWFVALSGREYDGHDFLGDAFSCGALGCIVAERQSYAIASTSFPLIAVTDTIEALMKLARNWRRRLGPKVVVVMVNRSKEICPAGEICYEHLQTTYQTEHFNLANESTGLVLNTVLNIDDCTQALVVELSPTSPEHIRACLSGLQPNVLIISQDGFDHLRMSSQSDFMQGMRTTFEVLDAKKSKVIVVSKDEEVLAASEKFSGVKMFFDSVSNEEDPDTWAGRTAALNA